MHRHGRDSSSSHIREDVRRFVQRCLLALNSLIRDCRASLSHHAEGVLVWYLADAFRDPSHSCASSACHEWTFRTVVREGHSCNELHHTAGFLDLALGIFAEVSCADDEGDLGDAALAEHFAVAEREEVEDGGGVGLAAGEVLFAVLKRDEGPELEEQTMLAITSHHQNASMTGWHTLSRLMTGFQNWFFILWKYRIPTLPK